MNNDLISRSALKEHKFVGIDYRINGKTLENITKAYQQGWNDAIDAIIDNAPTVEQNWKFYFEHGYKQAERDLKRPQSEWIDEGLYADYHSEHAYRCKKCGWHIIESPDLIFENRFCKHCGAEMKGGKK